MCLDMIGYAGSGQNISNIMFILMFRDKLETSLLGLSIVYLLRETLSFNETTTRDRIFFFFFFWISKIFLATARWKINISYILVEYNLFLCISRYILLEE